MKLNYLITGTGRNGTGYFSELLKYNDISCGHEKIFGLFNSVAPTKEFYKQKLKKNNKYCAESSWLVAPYLDFDLISEDVKILFLIRNPINTIKSIYDVGHISKNKLYSPYLNHILNNFNIEIENDLDFLINFYLKWSKLILEKISKYNNYVMKFEDLYENQDELSIFFDKKINILNKKINTKKTKKNRNIEILKVKNKCLKNPEMVNFMKEYNYIINENNR